MKNKIVFVPILIIILIISGIFLITRNKKFYLNEEYYKDGIIKDINLEELNKIIDNNESFILYTYNNYCNLRIPCGDIFKQVSEDNNITFYSIKYELFKDSIYHEKVSFAPSVLIIKEGKVVSFLDSESDKDLNKYQDTKEFQNWLDKYIYLSK